LVFLLKGINKKLFDGLLGFAAGAMIFVVAEEVIPESHRSNIDFATLFLLYGFVLMMILDVALS
jgi:zinc transporter, ZIP family